MPSFNLLELAHVSRCRDWFTSDGLWVNGAWWDHPLVGQILFQTLLPHDSVNAVSSRAGWLCHMLPHCMSICIKVSSKKINVNVKCLVTAENYFTLLNILYKSCSTSSSILHCTLHCIGHHSAVFLPSIPQTSFLASHVLKIKAQPFLCPVFFSSTFTCPEIYQASQCENIPGESRLYFV